jgi:hypothetical protein
MGNLLEDEAQRIHKLDERERALKEGEMTLKRSKDDLQSAVSINRNKEDNNTKTEHKLIFKQEEIDNELQRRINSILENERTDNSDQVSKYEEEILHVNGLLAELR